MQTPIQNEAIKKYFNKDFNNIFFNQSNKNNTLHLETILKENKFYEKLHYFLRILKLEQESLQMIVF